ncbi:hypothetical protein L6452_30918 [Arctium lappa]|uniref:Uncharacterized protein n=1 Tax=Arctium lappa TaxID=4217 RepID=A0ACB8ZJC0_ARCLA|nr:hypothetical protein L6452_30918 [Arctium lappa]
MVIVIRTGSILRRQLRLKARREDVACSRQGLVIPSTQFVHSSEGSNSDTDIHSVELQVQRGIQYEFMDYEEVDPTYFVARRQVPVDEWESLQDQMQRLDEYNWSLRMRCREYERDRRIAARLLWTRVMDRCQYWKVVMVDFYRMSTGILDTAYDWFHGGNQGSQGWYGHPLGSLQQWLEGVYYPQSWEPDLHDI